MAKTQTNSFGARLTRLMRLRGIDNETLRELSGVNASQISAFRGGLRYPRDDNQRKLAKALGVTRDQLTGDAPLPELDQLGDRPATQAAQPQMGHEQQTQPSPDISAIVQATTHAVLEDIAHAILDALTTRHETAAGRQTTGTRLGTPHRTSRH